MNHLPHVLTTIHEWDVTHFRRIVARPRTCPLIKVARIVSHSGNGYIYPLVPIILVSTGARDPWLFAQLAMLAFSVERIIYLLAKNWFKRKRPANILPDYSSVIIASDEFSFPSGHSSAAFLMVTLVTIFYGSHFTVLYLWSAAVAASRVVLGVHFPTDILVGSSMGTMLALLSAVYLL